MAEGFQTTPDEWGLKVDVCAEVPHNGPKLPHSVHAIVVLAGGIDDNFEVHPWVAARLDAAAMAYRYKKVPIICLGGGTYHKPTPVNKHGRVVHECTACAEYLLRAGVEAVDIYKEWASYDTIANGLFAFQHFLVPMQISSALVITSEFHMPRTMAIFDHMCFLHDKVHACYLQYHSTGNCMQPDMLEARADRERQSLAKYIADVRDRYRTIEQFLKWVYTEHACYNVSPYRDSVGATIAGSY